MTKSKEPRERPSQEQAFFQRRMAQLPAAAEKFGGVELPKAPVPSLDALHVTAPGPQPVTEMELLSFVDELVRERAKRTERKYGEAIQLGDEVTVDMLGYANGRLIPFSPRKGLVLQPGSGKVLPWLDEALLECAVGDSLELPVKFPDDEPVEELRGAETTWLIDVVAAAEVAAPDPDSDAFLKLLSKDKKTIDEAMEQVSTQLEDERIGEAWEEARERVIDELVKRSDVRIPVALIDEEIRRSWQRIEEPFLSSKGFDDDEKREALAGWLDDPETRLEAERSLSLAVVLRAIAEREKLEFDAKTLGVLVGEAKSRFKLTKQSIKDAIQDPAAQAAMVNLGMHTRALQYVLERATVTFEGVEGTHKFTAHDA